MPSAELILQRMRELQAGRERAIGPLAEVLARRAALLEELAATDEPYGKAYAEAEAAGWTPEELKALGADEPVRRPKGRPRKRRSTSLRTPTGAAATGPEEGSPATPVPGQSSPFTADPVAVDGASG